MVNPNWYVAESEFAMALLAGDYERVPSLPNGIIREDGLLVRGREEKMFLENGAVTWYKWCSVDWQWYRVKIVKGV